MSDIPNNMDPNEAAFASLMSSAKHFYEKGDYVVASQLFKQAREKQVSWRADFYRSCCIIYNSDVSSLLEKMTEFKDLTQTLLTAIVVECVDMDKIMPAFTEYMTEWLAMNKNVKQRFHDAVPVDPTLDQLMQYQTGASKGFVCQLDYIETWLAHPDVKDDLSDPDFVSGMTDIVIECLEEIDKIFMVSMRAFVDRSQDKNALQDMLNNMTNVLCNPKFLPYILQKKPDHAPKFIAHMKARIRYLEENTPKTGGCYVATAVYGSYDCPQVWTLRRYRDHVLAKTFSGRLFIKVYYAVSPTLVKWFGNTAWFRRLWQGPLDRMVVNLQKNGFADTPYEDNPW